MDEGSNSAKMVPIRAVRALCGVSTITIHRWQQDPKLAFPRPVYIRRRRFWREVDIVNWLESQTDAA